jgi:hypothetical protein
MTADALPTPVFPVAWSYTVTRTKKVPAVEKGWLTAGPEPACPSPKSQVNWGTLALEDALKPTGTPTDPLYGPPAFTVTKARGVATELEPATTPLTLGIGAGEMVAVVTPVAGVPDGPRAVSVTV